jgi:deoxyribonuclease V
MKPLHPWNVSVEQAIRIQEGLKDRIILKNTFSKVHSFRNSSRCDSKPSRASNPAGIILGPNPTAGQRRNISNGVKTIGGGDVAYSNIGNLLFGAIVVLSFPDMEILDMATADGKISFPYISGLLSFREGPILIKTFQNLKLKPDVMIYDGQGIAHPRGMGLASHMGLWLDLPSIGCAKTPLLDEFISPGPSRGSFEWIRRGSEKVGAVLKTRENVKPLFVSPGHRIDLSTSIQLILESCKGYRFPEPLRKAHQLSRKML